MQYPQNQSCCGSNPVVNGWSYCGCGNQYPVVPGTNPALQTWNGQTFVVADGSAQNPINLPFLQVNQGTPSYLLGTNATGLWSYYPPSTQQIANATNINGGAAGQIVYQTGLNTTGFTAAGATGQLLQSNGTSSPSWLAPSNLFVTATGSNTPRTLANRFADVVNVKDFGATGDGTTDDTAAIQAAVAYAVSIGATTVYFPNGNYNYTYFQLPDGIGFKFESSTVAGNKISPQLNSTSFCVDPFVYQAPANHQNQQYFCTSDIIGTSGSGLNGPSSAKFGKFIQIYKDNWTSATQANVGEIDAMYLSVYQGTNQATSRSDATAILSNVTQLAGTGFSAFCEIQNGVVDPTTFQYQKFIDVTIAPINEYIDSQTLSKYADGITINAVKGSLDNGVLVYDNGTTGTWANFITSQKQLSQISFIHDNSTGNLKLSNGNTSTNSIFAVIPQSRYIYYTSNSLTINSNYLDQTIAINPSSTCTVTLPYYDTDGITPLVSGFSFKVIQFGGNKTTFQAASPSVLRNVNSQYSTGGGYAVVTLQLISNVWVLSGSTGT